MTTRITTLVSALRAWLAVRAPRERLLLRVAGAAILGGALLTVADIVATERARQARSLPSARLALLTMEQDSLMLATLRDEAPVTATPATALTDSVRAAARARGIEAALRADGNLLEVHGDAELHRLIDWLAALHSEFRLRPRELDLKPADGSGRSRFQARFEAAGN